GNCYRAPKRRGYRERGRRVLPCYLIAPPRLRASVVRFSADPHRPLARRLLLGAHRGFLGRGAAGGGGALGGEVVGVEGAVELAADFRGLGAVSRAAALEEDHGHDVAILGVGVRGEPAEAGAAFGAGGGLAQDLLFAEVEAQAAGGAVLHGAHHAFGDLGNERADIELALHARLEVDDVIGRGRVLEVEARAAVGDGRDQRAELQGRHGDALAEGAHLAYAAELGGELLFGEGAEVLAGNVVSGKLAQAELVRVLADLFKAEATADGLKVGVVGAGQGFSEVHLRAAAETDLFFAGNDLFTQSSQGHSDLDGGAGLRAFAERQLLVDHGEDAPVRGVDGDHGAVHVAQGVNGGLADDGIFALDDVPVGEVVSEGVSGEALNVAMAAVTARGGSLGDGDLDRSG